MILMAKKKWTSRTIVSPGDIARDLKALSYIENKKAMHCICLRCGSYLDVSFANFRSVAMNSIRGCRYCQQQTILGGDLFHPEDYRIAETGEWDHLHLYYMRENDEHLTACRERPVVIHHKAEMSPENIPVTELCEECRSLWESIQRRLEIRREIEEQIFQGLRDATECPELFTEEEGDADAGFNTEEG